MKPKDCDNSFWLRNLPKKPTSVALSLELALSKNFNFYMKYKALNGQI